MKLRVRVTAAFPEGIYYTLKFIFYVYISVERFIFLMEIILVMRQ